MDARVIVWENSKKLWKHSPTARVPKAFLVLPGSHSCFCSSMETRYTFSISWIKAVIWPCIQYEQPNLKQSTSRRKGVFRTIVLPGRYFNNLIQFERENHTMLTFARKTNVIVFDYPINSHMMICTTLLHVREWKMVITAYTTDENCREPNGRDFVTKLYSLPFPNFISCWTLMSTNYDIS